MTAQATKSLNLIINSLIETIKLDAYDCGFDHGDYLFNRDDYEEILAEDLDYFDICLTDSEIDAIFDKAEIEWDAEYDEGRAHGEMSYAEYLKESSGLYY